MAIRVEPKPTFEVSERVAEFIDELDRRKVTKPAKKIGAPRKVGRPLSGKVRVTLLLDPDVAAKYRATGRGWHARMNDVLAKGAP